MRTVTIRGKRYRVTRPRTLQHEGDLCDGKCDPPDKPQKRIRLRSDLNGFELVETLIHEMLHASFWDIKEEAITEAAADITAALKSLGVSVGSSN